MRVFAAITPLSTCSDLGASPVSADVPALRLPLTNATESDTRVAACACAASRAGSGSDGD